MMADSTTLMILFILLGAIAAVIFSLRRMFILENKIEMLDEKILQVLSHVRRKK